MRRIVNVDTPTADNDAATKAYVDAMLNYIAMMAEVDLDALNDDGQEVSDESLEEVQ